MLDPTLPADELADTWHSIKSRMSDSDFAIATAFIGFGARLEIHQNPRVVNNMSKTDVRISQSQVGPLVVGDGSTATQTGSTQTQTLTQASAFAPEAFRAELVTLTAQLASPGVAIDKASAKDAAAAVFDLSGHEGLASAATMADAAAALDEVWEAEMKRKYSSALSKVVAGMPEALGPILTLLFKLAPGFLGLG